MISGLWRPHELRDGTYSLDDLADVHEALDLMAENEFRRREAMEANKGQNG